MRQIDGGAGLLPSRQGPEMTRTVQILLRPSFPAAASMSYNLQLNVALYVQGVQLMQERGGPGAW